MRRIWWIRHAPTHAKGMTGWRDLPADLSDVDRINRLILCLPDAPIVSSNLSRTVATADAIADGRPRLPVRPGLREISFGDWEGRTHDDVEAETPQLIRSFWDDPGDVSPPKGESWNAFETRVRRDVDALLDEVGGDLIVVAHFGVILTQLQRALRIGPKEAFGHKIDNLSLTCIRIADAWSAEAINHHP